MRIIFVWLKIASATVAIGSLLFALGFLHIAKNGGQGVGGAAVSLLVAAAAGSWFWYLKR